jgi:pimeloyl-ACP methyl ester carboxylesterase
MNPVLLLHGALGGKAQLNAIKQKLEGHGRIVYSMNFSGHGGVPFHSAGFGIEVFGEDVVHFMDSNSLATTDIFGYSMGGYVAIWIAHRHPHRVGKIITLGTKFDWSIESAEKEVRKLDPDKITAKIPAFARILEARHHPNDWRELLKKTSHMMMQLGVSPLLTEDILRSIKAPAEIYLGDKDDMADRSYSERVAKLLPSGEFQLLRDTAHPIEGVNFVPFI